MGSVAIGAHANIPPTRSAIQAANNAIGTGEAWTGLSASVNNVGIRGIDREGGIIFALVSHVVGRTCQLFPGRTTVHALHHLRKPTCKWIRDRAVEDQV